MTTREAEIARYVALYAAPRGAKYRTTAPRLALFRALLDERPDLRWAGLLDVGAGHGTMLKEARRAGYKEPILGTEVVPALAVGSVALAPAWDLPFIDRAFGTVTCFDVLEHLLPGDVPASLGELARVSAIRILVEVSCRPSNWTDASGQLHMTIWEPDRWITEARAAWPRWTVRRREDLALEHGAVLIEAVRT